MLVFELENGLRGAIVRRPGTGMAAVNVLMDTGSRDERRQATGIAHLFEHLMFGGTDRFPDYSEALAAFGGRDNAWTSVDFTNFYDILPAHFLEKAIELEADRLCGISFNPQVLEVQRNVVVEEFKQTHLNRPYGSLGHHLRKLLYSADHPYSWPTIGLDPQHILNADDALIRDWFAAHYNASNAVVAVVAPQPEQEVRTMIAEHFGKVPAGRKIVRRLPDPGFPTEDKELILREKVPNARITIAIPMSCYGTADYYAADTVSDILAVGKAARFQTRLIHGPVEGLFATADASIDGAEAEGFFMLDAVLLADDEDSARRAGQLMMEQLQLLADEELGQEELQRAFNNFETSFRLSNLTPRGLSATVAKCVFHGRDPETVVSHRRSLTADDIRRAARGLATRPHVTIIYLPE